MRVKICGVTRLEDALLAAELGADAVGFVFAPRSRRRADPREVAGIVRQLPPFVTAVGVFQDQSLAEVNEVVTACRLDCAQLHGGEDADYLDGVRCRVLKALSLSCRADLEELARFPGRSAFLLDSAAGGQAGGTGKTFDWEWARIAKRHGRVVLAGGLGPDNVAAAIEEVRPWGVDTASGTESAPGRKDPDKLRAFLRNARRAAELAGCRGEAWDR